MEAWRGYLKGDKLNWEVAYILVPMMGLSVWDIAHLPCFCGRRRQIPGVPWSGLEMQEELYG